MTKTHKIVGALFLILSSLYFIYGVNGSQTLLDKTVEHNTRVYKECFLYPEGSTGSDVDIHRKAQDCWRTQRRNTPDDMYLTVPKVLVDEGKCAISQTEDSHVEAKNGGMYATDLACKFESQGVYAPDYLDDMKEYVIESVGYDNLLGNFVILSFPDIGDEGGSSTNSNARWYFGHTVLDDKWKVGDTVTTGVRFAHADLSGATTGWHTHIELRRMYDGVWQSVRYVTRHKERKLEEKRLGSGSGQGGNNTIRSESTGAVDTYYFTHYAFVPEQTDGAPCISASGDDVCKLKEHGRGTMALTVDIRKKLGVNFGDKVALTGDVGCEGVYTVTDEMACRFRGEYAWANGPCSYSDGTPTPRTSHILRPGTPYYIKGDLPGRPGGACSIRKL